MVAMNPFINKDFVIATMHHKERVIEPLLTQKLQINCLTNGTINTDLLGTFSGEIERTLTAYEAAIAKCRMAFNLSDAEYAVASEGSFGPHPTLFFAPADEELMVCISRDEKLIVWAKHLTTETNYAQIENPSEEELSQFLSRTLFPSHKIIFKSTSILEKGIDDIKTLNKLIQVAKEKSEFFRIETDMRAHCNPTRMRVIEETTEKLIEKLKSFCPSCMTPGFSIQEVIKGLPCSQCGLPTESTLKFVKTCLHCKHKEEVPFPRGIHEEDPMYCNFCNP